MAAPTSRTLSESASKDLLRSFGVPMADEREVTDAAGAVAAAAELGFPVVAKLCGDAIAHKTERGLVRLNIKEADSLAESVTALFGAARAEDGSVSVLVAPMVKSNREFIAGVVRDPQFGPVV
ncbi:MAG: CoA-binding protein, partial [Acidimicrobiia bacterium]|nr:CoA-binding protein [Acidimicrobiia bacterium]